LSSQIKLLFRILQLPLSLAQIGLVLNHGRVCKQSVHEGIAECSIIRALNSLTKPLKPPSLVSALLSRIICRPWARDLAPRPRCWQTDHQTKREPSFAAK
jgi:hypothetical protein